MNILYVGPYRHNNDYGILSRLYLENLINSGNNVTCRSLYFGIDNIDRDLSELSPYEKNILSNYDVLVQHCPVDWAQTHGGFKRNIIIPILGNRTNLKDFHIKNLSRFDKIVVDNDIHESLFVRFGCGKNVSRISTPLIKNLCDSLREKKINLGIHNSSRKFYFFGNMHRDIELLQKILVSFFISFRGQYGNSLILFLDEVVPQDQKNLADMIKNIKQKLKINTSEKSISEMVIYKNLSFQEKIIIHNTCDILLNFSSEYRSMIQEQHAKYFNNSVLNIENTDIIDIPAFDKNAKYCPGETEFSILTQSLIREMVEISKKPTKNEKYNLQTFNTLSSIIV